MSPCKQERTSQLVKVPDSRGPSPEVEATLDSAIAPLRIVL